jgi:hypothetical protein
MDGGWDDVELRSDDVEEIASLAQGNDFFHLRFGKCRLLVASAITQGEAFRAMEVFLSLARLDVRDGTCMHVELFGDCASGVALSEEGDDREGGGFAKLGASGRFSYWHPPGASLSATPLVVYVLASLPPAREDHDLRWECGGASQTIKTTSSGGRPRRGLSFALQFLSPLLQFLRTPKKEFPVSLIFGAGRVPLALAGML